MAAAPQSGFMVLTKADGQQTKTIDLYASDVANALVNFDSGAGAAATSNTLFYMPWTGWITDFGIHTGMTDTTKISIMANNKSSGNMLRYAAHLDTSTGRPPIRIGIAAGALVSAIQLA